MIKMSSYGFFCELFLFHVVPILNVDYDISFTCMITLLEEKFKIISFLFYSCNIFIQSVFT
jgi:hypothetical protein